MKLTKKDIPRCEKLLKKWQTKLGLLNWEIFLYIEEPADHNALDDNRGTVLFTDTGRIADIFINKDRNWKNTYEIEKVIFHKLCEIMLGDLTIFYRKAYGMEKSDIVCHEIIRRLENLIFEQ